MLHLTLSVPERPICQGRGALRCVQVRRAGASVLGWLPAGSAPVRLAPLGSKGHTGLQRSPCAAHTGDGPAPPGVPDGGPRPRPCLRAGPRPGTQTQGPVLRATSCVPPTARLWPPTLSSGVTMLGQDGFPAPPCSDREVAHLPPEVPLAPVSGTLTLE